MAARPSKVAITPVAGRQAAVVAWRRLLQAVRRRERIAERETGLTGAQLLALRQLAAHPGATMGELARLTATDASSISVVVSRLLEKRVVRRVRDPLDQRRWRLEVTATGTKRLANAPESADARLMRAITDLPSRERAALAAQLEALAVAMEGQELALIPHGASTGRA